MEKQDFINDFIKDHEIVGWDEEGNEVGKGIWIDKEDYNEITELIKQVCGCESLNEIAALPLHDVINWVATKEKQPPKETDIELYSMYGNVKRCELNSDSSDTDSSYYPFWRLFQPPCL